jgi:hypothetical protein
MAMPASMTPKVTTAVATAAARHLPNPGPAGFDARSGADRQDRITCPSGGGDRRRASRSGAADAGKADNGQRGQCSLDVHHGSPGQAPPASSRHVSRYVVARPRKTIASHHDYEASAAFFICPSLG